MVTGMENRVIRDDHCFCCGKKNSHGLRLAFSYPRPGSAQTECTIPEHFSGWQKMTHGGLLAMLLDEAMAHACISREGAAVTVELTVRYVKPVEVGETIRITAEVREVKSRIMEVQGQIVTAAGELVARGSARFVKA